MIFASVGAVLQTGLMARARKRAFLFDSTVTPETALTDAVTWVKKLTEARSIAYNNTGGKLVATACSGIVSSQFYPAHSSNQVPFLRTVAAFALFNPTDTLSAEQRALKMGVMGYIGNVGLNGANTIFTNALAGPVSLSNSDVSDSYTPNRFPGQYMQTVLVPNSLASKLGFMQVIADVTARYSSAGSGTNYSYSYSYAAVASRYSTEANTYAQSPVSYDSSTQGTAVNVTGIPPAGIVMGYGAQRYYYNPLSGTTTDNYTYSLPGGNNNIPLQHAALFNFVATNQPDSPAFDFKWAGCPVWNGQKIVCEVFRVGTDLIQNAQGQTNVQPDLTIATIAAPNVMSVAAL